MIWKERVGNTLYVFFNGDLIYKRWIDLGYGRIFQRYGKFGHVALHPAPRCKNE